MKLTVNPNREKQEHLTCNVVGLNPVLVSTNLGKFLELNPVRQLEAQIVIIWGGGGGGGGNIKT